MAEKFSFKGRVASRPNKNGSNYRIPISLTAEEAVRFNKASEELAPQAKNAQAVRTYSTYYGEHTVYVNQAHSTFQGGVKLGATVEISLSIGKDGWVNVAVFATGKEKAAFEAARDEADALVDATNVAIATLVKLGFTRQQALTMQTARTTGISPVEIAKMMALLPSNAKQVNAKKQVVNIDIDDDLSDSED